MSLLMRSSSEVTFTPGLYSAPIRLCGAPGQVHRTSRAQRCPAFIGSTSASLRINFTISSRVWVSENGHISSDASTCCGTAHPCRPQSSEGRIQDPSSGRWTLRAIMRRVRSGS
jgi:hypothetical protein